MVVKRKNGQREIKKDYRMYFVIFFRILDIGMIIYIVIPIALDIPYLINKEYNIIQGIPTTINKGILGVRYLYQSVYIEEETIYYLGFPIINAKKEYKFYFLPHSKFGIKIIEVKK